MEILVQCNEVIIGLSFQLSATCGLEIKGQLCAIEKLPLDVVQLSINGHIIEDETLVLTAPALIRATVSNGLRGGKGGFGAMLRAMAKQVCHHLRR